MNVETARNDCLFHDTFHRKKDVKAVSSKVQVTPLVSQPKNATLGLLFTSSFGPRSHLSLRIPA